MESAAFLETAFPPVVIPLACWLLSLLATYRMDRTRKNLLSALSLACTLLLAIALLLFRLSVRLLGPPDGFPVTLFSVTAALSCGVGIFMRAWSLYCRDRLSAEDIARFCMSGFLIVSGALIAFHIVLYASA